MRDNTVSIAKAFGIILMVLGHANFYGWGTAFLYMFHMPLFFLLSGYCFKAKYLNDFKGFAKRRVTGVYWPFVKWSLIFATLHNAFFCLNIYNGEYGYLGVGTKMYSMSDYLSHVWQIVSTLRGNDGLLGGYWFLHTLFFASFMAYAAIWLCDRFKAKTIMGGVTLLAISILAQYFNPALWRIDIGGKEWLAAAFFVFGYAWRQTGWRVSHWWVIGVCAILVAVASIVHRMDMLSLTPLSTVPYFLVACAGTLMTMGLSLRIDSLTTPVKSLLVYIGDHTLEILTWHFLSFKLASLLIIWVEDRPIEQLAIFPSISNPPAPWWIPYLIVGVLVPCLLCKAREAISRKLSYNA